MEWHQLREGDRGLTAEELPRCLYCETPLQNATDAQGFDRFKCVCGWGYEDTPQPNFDPVSEDASED